MLEQLLTDLRDETTALTTVLDGLTPDDWRRPTPSAGWSVLDQVTHLAHFDELTALAVTDTERFVVARDELVALGDDFTEVVARSHRDRSPADVHAWFLGARAGLLAALGAADPTVKLPWFGPPMSPASSVTARLMETWAHGVDVADAVDAPLVPSSRLRHVAHLGVATYRWSFTVRGEEVPEGGLRVELVAPDGSTWEWGPEDAPDRVTGPALDFCLLVTQRRHRDDLHLTAAGPDAERFLGLAQAFAGPPGPGRPSLVDGAAR